MELVGLHSSTGPHTQEKLLEIESKLKNREKIKRKERQGPKTGGKGNRAKIF